MADSRLFVPDAATQLIDAGYVVEQEEDALAVRVNPMSFPSRVRIHAYGPPGSPRTVSAQAVKALLNKAKPERAVVEYVQRDHKGVVSAVRIPIRDLPDWAQHLYDGSN